MTVGVLMPVFVRTPELAERTLQTVASIATREAVCLVPLYNRYTLGDLEEFHAQVREAYRPAPDRSLDHLPGYTERCVAGTWNHGLAYLVRAYADLEFVLIINNDVDLYPETIDTLVRYGRESGPETVVLWSAVNARDEPEPLDRVTAGADFSCFMVRPDFLSWSGGFDENYTPFYYEDNDMIARIVLSGKAAVTVHAARYWHEGSMTIKLDAEARRRNNETFQHNYRYFCRKWGVTEPGHSPAEIIERYNLHPFRDRTKDVHWWPAPERVELL